MKKFLLIGLPFFLGFSLLNGYRAEGNTGLPPLIPMKAFFRNPEKVAFRLSPNGKYLAFMGPWKDRMNVYVQKIGEKKVTRITNATKRDIAGYFWANNHRIAFVQDKGGDENFRLYAVDIDGKNLKDLTPFKQVRVEVIDRLKDNDKEMIIGMNRRDKRIFDAYRIDINTGKMEMIAKNPGNIDGWLTDNAGRLRVAVTSDGIKSSILYRDRETDKFRVILTRDFRDTIDPLFFSFDNKYIYVSSNIGRDKCAIVKYDPHKKKEVKVIYENPQVDVSNLLRSKKRKVITGVAYITDKIHYHFFDKKRKELQEFLEQRLPGYEVVVTDMNKNEDRVLVRTFSDKSMGAYYYYNMKDNDFRKLIDVSPWLNEKYMADMKPIEYPSVDGLTIHGYLTLPRGIEPKNLPLVVNPHGGPWARDVWGFDSEVQFLANRGYAVLQMNFRGSTGYGKKFWEAGFKQWGRKMQDDITCGVKYLIRKGIVDPKRVGIYGASYGGYATLAGLTFTPDLYACGVDYVGVSNIFLLLKTIPPYWELGRQVLYQMIGDPVKDKGLLRKISPLFHADRIKAPIFIAQGANDPRVNKAESDQMVDALRKRGIPVIYMVKNNEGHGFHNEENRFDFYRTMGKFLHRYLGGRVGS